MLFILNFYPGNFKYFKAETIAPVNKYFNTIDKFGGVLCSPTATCKVPRSFDKSFEMSAEGLQALQKLHQKVSNLKIITLCSVIIEISRFWSLFYGVKRMMFCLNFRRR